ncbi:aminotransferase family protein-like protein [Xylaria grammica]|nr:aminotransferase family protein-like protein [Xylaria grammica]
MTLVSLDPAPAGPVVPFGRAMRDAHFGFDPAYVPINHGSYGAYPLAVREAHAALRAEVEGAPDRFIVIEWPARLRASRAAVARMLRCATDELVFTPNATTASDTVFKNLRWRPGDVVLVYDLVYNAAREGLRWLEDTLGVRVEVVPLELPRPDAEIVAAFVDAARRINATGTARVRLAVLDTIISTPGVRIPFEALVPALQAEGALVLVDAAHGIGHVHIDLEALRPDFLVTSLNKWLFVPRGVSALYVPVRNQALIRSTVPTSARYRGRAGDAGVDSGNSFVEMFDFVATLDMTNFLMVKAALSFRTTVCGGEPAISAYCRSVAQQGAAAAARVLGTRVMDCSDSCLRDCYFANVALPLEITSEREPNNGSISRADADAVIQWIREVGVAESACYAQICVYRDVFWWRLSGMVYVEVADFVGAAEILVGLCERAGRGEYLEGKR